MRSIHVEVRRAVIDGISAAINDPRISVTYGWQGADDAAKREQIFTSNARGAFEPAAMRSGRNFRKEEMEFDLTILVEGVGKRPDEVEERAMELGLIVEEFIADRKSNELGIEGLNWIVINGVSADYRAAAEAGSIALVVYTVRYNARIT